MQPRREFREATAPGAVRLQLREKRVEKVGGPRRLAAREAAPEREDGGGDVGREPREEAQEAFALRFIYIYISEEYYYVYYVVHHTPSSSPSKCSARKSEHFEG